MRRWWAWVPKCARSVLHISEGGATGTGGGGGAAAAAAGEGEGGQLSARAMTAAVVDQPAYSAMVVIITLVGGCRWTMARGCPTFNSPLLDVGGGALYRHHCRVPFPSTVRHFALRYPAYGPKALLPRSSLPADSTTPRCCVVDHCLLGLQFILI